MKTITGKVVYVDLTGGFWGIISKDGKNYRPTNLPHHLKENGKNVSLKIKEVEEDFSIYMWGTPIEIL
jgi:hypothetical protein